MMVVKKNQVVLVALAVLILVAGYLNWSYQKDMQSIETMSQSVDESAAKNLGEAQLVNGETENEEAVYEQEASQETGAENPYFANARMEKEKTRSEGLAVIQSVVNNANSSKESKEKAQSEIIAIGKAIEQEGIVESLIKAKGFNEVVVFVNQGTVNVVLRTEGLIPAKVAQIQDIVVTQTGIPVNKIKINEVK